MPRLTQSDSRAITRGRLIEAAEQVFAAKGFAAASLEEIADKAGYTRGALYYNFSGKDELFLAVLAKRTEADIAEVGDLLEHSVDPKRFTDALREAAERRRSARNVVRWMQLFDEFWLYAMRNPAARQKLAEHQDRLRTAYANGITAILSHLGVPPPAPVHHLAAVILAIDFGLPRQQWLDPKALPEGLFFDTLDLLIRAAKALHDAPR